jgi:uncharacterized protein YoxC
MILKFKITSLLFFLLISINSLASPPTVSISSSSTSVSQDKRLDKVENDMEYMKDMQKRYEKFYEMEHSNLIGLTNLMVVIFSIALGIFLAIQYYGVRWEAKKAANEVKIELNQKIEEVMSLTSTLNAKHDSLNKDLNKKYSLLNKELNEKQTLLNSEIAKAKQDFENVSKSNFQDLKTLTGIVENELLGYVFFYDKKHDLAHNNFIKCLGRWQTLTASA